MDERVEVNEKQLSAAIAGWIRSLPKGVVDQLVEHKILTHYKRSSMQLVRLESEIAQHIAAEMTRLDWRVNHKAPQALGSPPPFKGD